MYNKTMGYQQINTKKHINYIVYELVLVKHEQLYRNHYVSENVVFVDENTFLFVSSMIYPIS